MKTYMVDTLLVTTDFFRLINFKFILQSIQKYFASLENFI